MSLLEFKESSGSGVSDEVRESAVLSRGLSFPDLAGPSTKPSSHTVKRCTIADPQGAFPLVRCGCHDKVRPFWDLFKLVPGLSPDLVIKSHMPPVTLSVATVPCASVADEGSRCPEAYW